jgi:hypothetical protein
LAKLKPTSRSLAARRGWVTRRANERKRSERAQRGWVTRRRNERKKKRIVGGRGKKRKIIGGGPSVILVREWIVSFSYARSGRSFDVIVTARTEEEAEQTAMGFLSRDKGLGKVKGWSEWNIVAAQGRETRRKAGHAEFRSKS